MEGLAGLCHAQLCLLCVFYGLVIILHGFGTFTTNFLRQCSCVVCVFQRESLLALVVAVFVRLQSERDSLLAL